MNQQELKDLRERLDAHSGHDFLSFEMKVDLRAAARCVGALEVSDYRLTRLKALNEALTKKLSMILSAVKPELINSKGRTYEFAPPPDVVFLHWSRLSEAIRKADIDATDTVKP